ncbi:MAG: Gfo/Idh/MocA family oxidoreductase [Clostridia bacterium]|nr:Gfo/Idh/MocA family oxidoreductase [Clostridia bacterium]
MYNFGIVGCGVAANIHASALAHIPNACLLGVADNSFAVAESFVKTHGGKAYKNYEEMLKDSDLDAVCICTPSGFHAENAIQALQSGKHVVLEKPMALTVEETDEIIRVCEQTGKYLTVISQLRFSEDILQVKNWVKEGVFGKIVLCDLYMKYWRSKGYYEGTWKGTKKFDGGGALLNQGIHGVDLLEYIVGPVRNLQSKIKTLVHDIEVEDTAVALLEFENGALGVIEASTCTYPGFERKLKIHGDNGYVILQENQIVEYRIGAKHVRFDKAAEICTVSDPTALPYDKHKLQIQNLIAAIEGREELLIDCYEGRKAVKLINEIYKNGA